MGISGNIKTMVLAELLQWLSQGQKTGTLVIDNGKVEKRVFFNEGSILSSASTDPKEYLGHFLVSHGHISEEEVNRAVARQEGEKLLIGKILVDMGAITEQDLHELLQLKAEESIYDIFTWPEGDFRFLDGELPEKTMIPMRLDVQWIVLEGSRRLDEWNRVREIVSSPLMVPVLVVDPDSLEMEDTDRRILSWVDDDQTVEEISHASKTSLFQVSQVLARQVSQGHLKVVRPRIIEVEIEVPVAKEIEQSGYHRTYEETGPIPVGPNMNYPPGQGGAGPHHPNTFPTMPVPAGGPFPGQVQPVQVQQPFVQQQPLPNMVPPQAPQGYPSGGSIDVGGRRLHFAGSAPQNFQDAATTSGYVTVGGAQPAPQHQPASEAEKLVQQAESALQEGEYDAAIEKFRRAKEATGTSPQIEQRADRGEENVRKALEREGFSLSAVPKLECEMGELTKLSISPQQGFMLTRLNGSYDIKSLLKLSPMPALEAQIFFWQLSKSGHVSL